MRFMTLMADLGVESVYWIDDENATARDLDLDRAIEAISSDFANAAVSLRNQACEVISSAIPKQVEPQKRLGRHVAKLRKAAKEETRDTSAGLAQDVLTGFLSEYEGDEAALITQLRDVLDTTLRASEREQLQLLFGSADRKWEWRALSFSDWTRGRNELLGSSRTGRRTFFIVDLENKFEQGQVNGSDVLRAIANERLPTGSARVIVLTGNCTPEDELRQSRQLTQEHFGTDFNDLPVFVMSKARLVAEADAKLTVVQSSFEKLLSRIDMSVTHLELAQSAREVFRSAIDAALEELRYMTVEELMYAVSGSSHQEGVPELDTLLRIFSASQRTSLHQAVVQDQTLRQILGKLRAQEPDTRWDGSQRRPEVRRISHLMAAELYDPGEVVNSLLSQVQSGDLYEFLRRDGTVEATKVLVGNPCDLALRQTGKRNLRTGILLPLEKTKPQTEDQMVFAFPHAAELGFEAPVFAKLSNFDAVPLDILDLCWTNVEGVCVWARDGADAVASGLPASQRARLSQLRVVFSSTSAGATLLERFPAFKPVIQRDATGRVRKADFFIRRVGRLTFPHALQLAVRFGATVGRPSSHHDFAAG